MAIGLLIIIQALLMLVPPWIAWQSAKRARALGAPARGMVRWATGVLALAAGSMTLGCGGLWMLHTDPAWQQASVDTPGLVLALEMAGLPLLALPITFPFSAFIWKEAQRRAEGARVEVAAPPPDHR